MTDERLPEVPADLRAFLYSCIDGVEQVEILAGLSRANRARTARQVALELGVPDAVARHHLESLVARGLLQITVAAEVSYAYAPKSTELRQFAERLVDFYATSRTSVLRFIAASPRRVKRFSDAFKLRDPE